MLLIYQTITGLFVFLILATIMSYFLGKNESLSDLKMRLLSWWIILPIFSIALSVNGSIFFILLCFISFMAFKEFISVIPTRQSDRALVFLLYLASPVQFFFAWSHHPEFAHFITLSLFLIITVYAVITNKTKGMLASVATLFFGLVLTVYCLSFVAYLNTIPSSNLIPTGGTGLVLFLVILTELNDVAQYCWGKLLGGRKIIPHVSPNKTLSGFLGGLLTTSLLALPLGIALISLSILQALAVGILISIGGFLGDVLMSGVKRDLDIKDFSSFIPAHGGMLDHIDSLILTAPLFFYALKWLHLGG